MSAILWLDQISKSDLLLVGGKGANLGEMSKAGFPVPRGFCITTSAYRRQIEETIIGRNLPGLLAGPRETLSEALGPLFLNTSILPEIETEIRDAYRRIGEGARVAVRSSATAEDLPEASFAGQQETFLGISGVEALLLAVRRCWASLWSSRAIHYREKQGINHASVGLAVVVQEMVAADVAGVMFTVNPVTGAADEAVITASYGLGEAVVSGLVIPDTYVVSKQRLTISKRESGRKESKVVQEGQGTVVIPMPAAEQENKLCLPDATVAEIARAGLNVERHYGEPQDIEWALAGGQLYVLQARPVTALPKGSQQPPLPGLEDDVHGWIYVGRMPSFIRRRLLPSIPDHFPRPLRPFDISCNTAAALDGARRVAAELGIKLPADVVRPHESGLVLFSPPLPSVFRILLRLPFMWRGLKEWTRYDPGREWREVDELALRPMLPAAPSSETTMEQSLAGIDRLRGVITELMYRRFRKYMAAGAAAHRRLTVLLRRLYGDEAARVKQQLMLSLDHKTALSNRAMKDLARSAASTPAVREILTSRPFGAMHAAILADPRCGAFAGQLARFLGEFGDRTALTMEPQPSYPAWADEPDQVLGLIATTIRYPDSLVDHTARDEETYRRARAEIAARLARKPRLAAKFEWAVDTARSFVVAREASLYFLEEVVGLIRSFAGRLAERLVSAGRLGDARSIFFLLPDELRDLVAGERIRDIRSVVEQRRIVWKRMRESWDRSPPQRGETRQTLKGAPVSQGVAIGAVKVIRGADEFHKLKPGDILVCSSTTPAWTPLFSVAAAVVADAGGPLSHAAIVAREYGIPAVMGCTHATNMLADGERVEVNGTSGLVRRLSPIRDRALGPVQETSATSASGA